MEVLCPQKEHLCMKIRRLTHRSSKSTTTVLNDDSLISETPIRKVSSHQPFFRDRGKFVSDEANIHAIIAFIGVILKQTYDCTDISCVHNYHTLSSQFKMEGS
jgi:hypothetical protein